MATLRRTLTAVIVMLATICLFAPAAPAAHADGDTVGIAIAPSNGKTKDGRSRFTYKAKPGSTATDHVQIRNVGTVESTITVRASDAYTGKNGTFSLKTSDQKPTEAGSWVTFGGKDSVQVTLKPQESRQVEFTMATPANATPGDHAAGIVASVAAQGDGNVRVERRIAVRMYIRVPGKLTPALAISNVTAGQDFSLNPADAPVTVRATVKNTGNVALHGRMAASLRWFGLTVATTQLDVDELLPGTSVPVTLRFDDNVPQTMWLRPHLELQPMVAADAIDPGPLSVVTYDGFIWAVPWTVVVMLVVVLTFVMVTVVRRRKSRKSRHGGTGGRARGEGTADVAEPDTKLNVETVGDPTAQPTESIAEPTGKPAELETTATSE
ncbi:WxL protein peptidoglycan domain-containing protein [Bifidobacterium leontopitheci]|uniref:WxL Interacting Protein peptidoglycan binding domain-containing protein n=1 Tax=Bifidobacterium leontopitheci TaxID=2650774 RepID=A0A6I1GFP3_9BIFI|nr:DUF916 domain-containing protein [Bifidobacterium leontopitheci]KAB7790463.1 hypothetical protein F7D09_1059 [Bifidobacterium leontopitheci]